MNVSPCNYARNYYPDDCMWKREKMEDQHSAESSNPNKKNNWCPSWPPPPRKQTFTGPVASCRPPPPPLILDIVFLKGSPLKGHYSVLKLTPCFTSHCTHCNDITCPPAYIYPANWPPADLNDSFDCSAGGLPLDPPPPRPPKPRLFSLWGTQLLLLFLFRWHSTNLVKNFFLFQCFILAIIGLQVVFNSWPDSVSFSCWIIFRWTNKVVVIVVVTGKTCICREISR